MAELSSQPLAIQSVYGMYAEDKLFVNRRYQRKLVWTLEEKQRLIESILKSFPIPAILIAERESAKGTYEIIDGLQRLHAIVSFIEGSFKTLDGRLFDLNHFANAKRRADEGIFTPLVGDTKLTQKEVSVILDYSMAWTVMRGATETDIDDVFGRINMVGVVREAKALGVTIEQYFALIKKEVGNSGLSEDLKKSILSSIDYNSYYGLGVIAISVPAQKDVSYFDGDVYWRSGDSTQKASKAADIAGIAKRFG
ncbi:DUF262 domain-containing protein [Hansschlegelia quercus]|uniref:DUF262 domain-containing protein n=1 Tax=Hansschlegelia quercus TaxID=2528245 RepID=A0A4Q9GGB8_9HYPH|nr:DUF262 domain-containing protein [Hansschlegelia quercus]TBN52405.1 DUF262 domain-containing protein [Hansschlegelia quercus]